MKNTLVDLNNHLFAELKRLSDEDLTSEELEAEAPVTNREHLEMNRNGFRTSDPELTKAGINVARLMVRTKQRELEERNEQN